MSLPPHVRVLLVLRSDSLRYMEMVHHMGGESVAELLIPDEFVCIVVCDLLDSALEPSLNCGIPGHRAKLLSVQL